MPDDSLDTLPAMLTVKQVADYMQVNIRTVQDWVNAGELARVMIGKREYRIRRSELMRFIEERERKG
jgi:excisionase family DNA binding protein